MPLGDFLLSSLALLTPRVPTMGGTKATAVTLKPTIQTQGRRREAAMQVHHFKKVIYIVVNIEKECFIKTNDKMDCNKLVHAGHMLSIFNQPKHTHRHTAVNPDEIVCVIKQQQ